MKKNLAYGVIIILSAIAIFLGYKIYQQYPLGIPWAKTEPGTVLVNQSVAPKETDVLNFPGPNASDEENKKFAETVSAYANEAEFLDISGCKPNPLALKVKLNSEFKIRNSDKEVHKLSIAGEEKYNIPANTTKIVKADFEHGIGIYGYSCDENTATSGIFLVVD